MKKLTTVSLLLVFVMFMSATISSAQLRYKVDYRMLFDNLEGSMPYTPTRTISGVLFNPTVGYSFGNHSLMVGTSVLERFGTDKIVDNIDFRAYYEYKDTKFKALAGIFSRSETKGYPLSYYTSAYGFLNDKLQGFYGKYEEKNGYIETFVDWNKSDVANGVDRFTLMFSGERRWNGFRLKGIVSYKHFADKPVFEDFTVFDRFQYDLNVGYDFARHQDVFSTILLTAGLSGDGDRARNDLDKGLEVGIGFQTEQVIKWKNLTLHNTFYTGQPQMGYYKEYPFVYSGSPFYRAEWHDMLIAKYAYNYKWLTVSASFVGFFMPDTISTQQLVSVSFSLDDVVNFGKNKKK